MTKEFKVGQRVRVYDNLDAFNGEIEEIFDGYLIKIKNFAEWVHKKQCRRLIKKPRKEVTREMLLQAWVTSGHVNFGDLANALETKLGRKLKDK